MKTLAAVDPPLLCGAALLLPVLSAPAKQSASRERLHVFERCRACRDRCSAVQ